MVGYIVSNPLEFLFPLLPFGSDSTTTVVYSVDVITFTYNNGTSVSHTEIYIGDGMMVHAVGSSTSRGDDYLDKVKIDSIEKGSYWYDYIYNCRRLY